jgi:CreA protein
MKKAVLALLAVAFACLGAFACLSAGAEPLGEVKTAFHFGGSDKIVVDAYDDPLVAGVACYVSRAKTGGIKGTLGFAEDKSEVSIACRQVGPIAFRGKLPAQGDVFTERLSVLFKTLHIVRIVDPARNSLVYLTYSDKLVDGSPKNSVTAVPVPANNPIPVR